MYGMNTIVLIRYTNWKGVTSDRRVRPVELWFGATEYHSSEQWFLKALDIEKDEERDFAMKDIVSWNAE